MVKKICVVGLGYVGLPTVLSFAEAGYSVIGSDIRVDLIDRLNSGKSPIPEVLSDERIQRLQKKGSISFTTDTPAAVRSSDAVLITVPTPIYENKLPDLRPVESAAKAVAEGMGKGKLVVLESTVYPGVTEEIVQPIIEKKTGLKAGRDYGLAYCPERYNPGDKEHTIDKMQRIVGAIDTNWLDIVAEMYSKITTKSVKKVSSIKTAEAAKVIENTQRDLNIGLMNELALIFDKMGLDTREVIDAASTKWNFQVYWPGPGVGGHCFDSGEYLFVKNDNFLRATQISNFVNEELNNGWGKETLPNGVSLVFPKGIEVLSFDLKSGVPCFRQIKALSKRSYAGNIVRLRTKDGRVISVTDRHPAILYAKDGFMLKPAGEIRPGDRIPIMIAFPDTDLDYTIDVINALTSAQINKTRVKPLTTRFCDYKQILSRRAPMGISDFSDYYRDNSMPLAVYLKLEAQGKMPIGRDKVLLCTGRGPSYNQIMAVIHVDGDFARMVGYYLSEGCLTKDKSLRVRFTFNRCEREYISDLESILSKLGLKYSEYHSKKWASCCVKVSSEIFGHLIRDVLGCGADSYTMCVPEAFFLLSRGIRRQLLVGLLRGDGGVDYSKGKRTYTKNGHSYKHIFNCADISYYSASPILFQQVVMLLQSEGVTPTFKVGLPYLRLWGVDIKRMGTVFKGTKEKRLCEYISRSERVPASRVFTRHGTFATTPIMAVEKAPARTVYSIEVEGTGTVVSTSGIITHNCLPVDPYYLVWKSQQLGYDPKIITAGREVNDYMAIHVVNLAERALKTLKGRKVAILGASYKGNVADARETPAKRICTEFKRRGAQVVVCDPLVNKAEIERWGVKTAGFEEAITGADCFVIHSEHDQFKSIDLDFCASKMRTKAIVDARGFIDKKEAANKGFLLERI